MASASLLASTTQRPTAPGVSARRRWPNRQRMPSAVATASPRDGDDVTRHFPDEMRAACEAVRLASIVCVETQRTLTSGEKVSKSDDSPVTVADFAAQCIVTSVLQESHPDIQMVAEESADDLRGEANAPLLDRVTQVVVVEASDGQLEDELRLALSHENHHGIQFHNVRHMGGILPEVHEVVEKVRGVTEVHQ